MNQIKKAYERNDFHMEYDPFRPGISRSAQLTLAYLDERNWDDEDVDARVVVSLAVARLSWLLQRGREQLSGRFDEDDLQVLMNCFQNEIFSPENIRRIPTSVCDEYGIDLDRYQKSRLGPLVDKILDLDRLGLIALADALEQAWRGVGEKKVFGAQAFEALGIELCSFDDETEAA